ncbi:Fic family protein [Porticoccus sp. GXU_MW_L64]
MSYTVGSLPIPNESELETRRVLKQVSRATRYLAELKGAAKAIPNEGILIDTLTLQEAKDSSEVENIVTTHDELYKANLFTGYSSPATKEVQNYSAALKKGFDRARQSGLIRLADILDIQQTLEGNRAGLRKLPGTELKNLNTGEVVYTPPQQAADVERLIENLVHYLNDDELSPVEPLVKMAIIHFQFESIHPFYDGNGRTGRILNILYLVAKDLLELPILYLGRYITQNKAAYYQGLQGVRDNGDWEPWLLYMLQGVEQTAKHSIGQIDQIKQLMQAYKVAIRTRLPKMYSQDLLNNLFRHPYTKIDFVVRDLRVTRVTATKYLEQLVMEGLLIKEKVGRNNYYINRPLCDIFM